jgi:CarboxypepD_reg-like domain
MRIYTISLLLSFFGLLCLPAQSKVMGYLRSEQDKIIEYAEVVIKDSDIYTKTDKVGYFQFVDLEPGKYTLVFSKPGFENKQITFVLKENEQKLNLGHFRLYSGFSDTDLGLNSDESSKEDDNNQQQNPLGLLNASRDPFNAMTAYNLSSFWFRPRGLDSRSSSYMLNGMSMTRPDNGQINFNNLGGYLEILRYPDIAYNQGPSESYFGGINSSYRKNTNAGDHKRGHQFSYAITNQNYHHRLSYRYSTGFNKNGWAYTGFLARRWADEGVQEGASFRAYNMYLGIEKKIDDDHKLSFNIMASPYLRGLSSANTEEVTSLMGKNYNSYWGWQDGKKRNERMKHAFQPIISLSHDWKINDKSSLYSAIAFQFGSEESSRLVADGASSPSPTYYKNLPSYWAQATEQNPYLQPAYDQSLTAWQNKLPQTTQINWQNLYQSNANVPIKTYFEGQVYQTTGKKALYYLAEDVKSDKIFSFMQHYKYDGFENLKPRLNLSMQYYQSQQFRRVKDLLGADFALNVDPYANFLLPEQDALYNTNEQNVSKKVGDKINYDYCLSSLNFEINPSATYNFGNFSVAASCVLSYKNFGHQSAFNHYLYDDAGQKATKNFINFGLKTEFFYAFSDQSSVFYRFAHYDQAPFADEIFINPRYNQILVYDLESTRFLSQSLVYAFQNPKFKFRTSLYHIDQKNMSQANRFVSDDGLTNDFVTQLLTNVNQRNIGLEIGTEYNFTSRISASAMASIGHYVYTNAPDVYEASDRIWAEGEDEYKYLGQANMEGMKVGGSAQKAASVGLKYSSPNYWWAAINANYLWDNQLEPPVAVLQPKFTQNPNNSMPYDINKDDLKRILSPTVLPNAFFINLNAGKSWVMGKLQLLLTANMNNVFNQRNYVTGGYQQSRLSNYPDYSQDFNSKTPMYGPKYWYQQGRSYFINLQIKF